MPSTVVDDLRKNVDVQFQAANCYDHGCSLSLDDSPDPNLLIKAEDMAPKAVGQCDFLFVGGEDQEGGGPWVVPVELTSGRKRANRFLRQLRSGAELADCLLPPDVEVRFCPIAVHGRELHPKEFRDLRARRVKFREDEVLVSTVRCETRLVDALQ